MKKISKIIISLLILLAFNSYSQSISNYAFSMDSSSSLTRSNGSLVDDIDMTSGLTILLGGSNVNTYSAATNIGFDFWINGTRQTQFNVSSNGWVGLPTSYYTYGWLQYTGLRLAPFLPSASTNMATAVNGVIHSKTIGTAPSRICVIEFLNMVINSSVTTDTTTFQVRLYEQTGAIEYVYGPMRISAGASSSSPINFNVGFQVTTTVFQSVNINAHTSSTSANSTASFTSNGIIPQLNSFVNGSRKCFRWIPNPPNDPTNLTFTSISGSAMTLNWTASSNATSYALYKSLDYGTTYTYVATFPSTTLSSVQTGLPASTDVYWRLFAIRESVSNNLDGDAITLTPAKIYSVASGNWSSASTWSGGVVPSTSDSVLISSGNTVNLDVATETCFNLEVAGTLHYGSTAAAFSVSNDIAVYSGGVFDAGSSSLTTHTLNIGGTATSNVAGNLSNDGTFDMNTSANVGVTFFGALNSGISGSGSTYDFAAVTINKGTSSSAIVDVTAVITMAAPATGQRLTLTNGTFKLSSASTITPYNGSSFNTACSGTARLWVNNSGAVINTTAVSGGYIYFTTGSDLRIDNGTVTLGSGTYPFFCYGMLRMNGGTLTCYGGIYTTTSATSGVIMSAGNLNLDPQGAGNVSTAYPSLYIYSGSTFLWSGGTITIVNPHSVAGGTAVSITSGTITGGTLQIGDGISTKTGGTFSNTSGFAINSAIDFYNVTINNTIGASNTRMVRLLADLRVDNLLEIKPGGYLFNGSGTTGYGLHCLGGLKNNGTIAGTEPGGTQQIGSVSFEGNSGSQSVIGGGSIVNGNIFNINNIGSGVTFGNSTTWSIPRVNLIQGSVTPGSNLTIGTATVAPTIQIGGIDELTAAGTFTSLPSFNTSFGNASYIYGPTSSTLITGSFNEIPSGAQSLSTLTIADADGLVSNKALTVNTLNLSAGNLSMGNNNLAIGTSASNAGILNRTSGLISFNGGAFTRWYASGTQPTYGYSSGFPILSGTNDRSVYINSTGNLTSGGSISVLMNNVTGYTNISPSFTDGSITINRRTNSNWLINTSGINVGLNTFSLRLTGQGAGAVSNVASLMMVKSNTIETGTVSAGTGTLSVPIVNRDFTQSQIPISDTLYIGSDSTVNPLSPMYTAIATGNWNDPTIWDAGAVPSSSNDVLIPSPYTVTLTTGTNNCKNLNITSGGTLTANVGTLNIGINALITGTLSLGGATLNITGSIGAGLSIITGGVVNASSGTMIIGPTGGGNQTLNVAGTLNISGGNITINGNFNVAAGASFVQSAGTLTIDGNSGTAASSVPQGTHLCNFSTNNLNCSGGTILIVDPPHSSYATSTTNALRITATASTSAFSGTHSFQFGDGVSTTIGNANGFSIDTKRSGVVPIQNIIANGGNLTGRWISSSYSAGSFGTHIKGNLTINSNSEFRHTIACQLAIGGNIINNGTLTTTQPFTLGGIGYVITFAQTISGSGTFRNSTTVPTGAFTTLTVDDNSGLTLASSALTFGVSGTLTIGANKITTGNNIIKINSTGTLSRTTGYIVGNLSKNYAIGSSVVKTYEIGNAANYLPVTLTFPSVTTAGDITLSLTDGNHPQISSSCFNSAKTIGRYWSIFNSGVAPVSYNLSLNYLSSDPASGINLSNINSQFYNGTSWNGNLTATANTTSATLSGLTSVGDLQLGEFTTYTVSVSISASATTVCSGTSVTFTATPINGGSTPTYQWKKNGTNIGTNSNIYTDNGLVNSDQILCTLVSSLPCALTPNATSSTITMTVTPPSIGGSVTGGTAICSGQTSGTLTLSGNTGTITGWESSVSPFTTWTSITNTSSTYTSGALTQTTMFHAIVQNGSCAPATSSATTVTITSPSAGGSVTGGSTICSGSTSGTLTLSGNTGTITSWESSVSPFTTWTSITNTSSTYTSGALTQTTMFHAIVQNGSCASATSSATTVTVNPGSVGGSVTGGTTICSGATSGTLTLSGNTGTITGWESSVSPFTTWTSITNTSSTYTSGALTQTTMFHAIVQNGSCTPATSSATTVTVNPGSVGGSVTGGTTICSGATSGTLTLSGNTGTITSWESSVSPFTTWTTITNTSSTYTSGALTQTTMFHAIVQSGSCASATSSATTVTVNPSSVGGSVTGGSTICSGSTSGTLTLSGNTGTITGWESSVSPFTTWTSITNTSSTYTSGALTQTTMFHAIVQSGSCASATSSATTVTVNPGSVGGSVTGGSTICSGATSGTLTLSGNTGTVTGWESSVSPFTTWTSITNTSSTYTSGALTQTTMFHAIVQNGSCPSATSSASTVTVNPSSVGGSVTGGSTICSGSTSGTLTLSGNTGSITSWESSVSPFTTWTTITNTSSTYTSGALTQTTMFHAIVQSGSCTPATSSATTVTVNPGSVGGSVTGGTTICSGATSGTLTLSGNTGTITSWESSVSPFTTWTSITNTSSTYTSGALTQTTMFHAIVQNGSCTPATSSATTVTVNPGSVGGSVTGGTTICSGATSGTLTLSGNTGTITSWESSVSPFTTWTTITNTSSTYTSGALTQTTMFHAIVQSGSCASATSSATTVTVNPSSVGGSVTGGSTICSGATSGTLTLSGNTGTVTGWESSVSPFTTWTSISNTSTTYTSGALSQTTQFRALVQSGSCSSDTSSSTTVTVNPGSLGGSVTGGSTICSGSTSGTLTLSGNTGTITGWESSVSPFTTWTSITNTSSTYTSGALTQTTMFHAIVQNGSCTPATSSATTVTVNPGSVGGSVTGGTTICSGSTSGTLTLSGNTGSIVSWLSSVSPFTTWTSISNTASTYTSGALTQTTKFRALIQSGSCSSDTSSAVTVTVNPGSVGGSVSGSSPICSGTSSTLTLTGYTGLVVGWESSVSPFTSWTSLGGSLTTFNTPTISQTTKFHAVVQNGSCASATSTDYTVNVIASGIWLGTTSSNWNDASNWSCGIPTSATDVVINSGTPNNPVINTTAIANNVTVNSGASLSYTGSSNSIDIRGALTVIGTFNTANGAVIFGSASAQTIPGINYNVLSINGSSNKILGGSATISSLLNLNSGTISLGTNNITIGAGGQITGGSNSNFIITNGTGKLIQNNIGNSGRAGSIQFPVGSSASSYTPIWIINTGTTDNYNVRVIGQVNSTYSGEVPTGTTFTSHAVNKTWFINEGTTGGSTLTLTIQWNAADELTSFTNSNCNIATYNGTNWVGGSLSAAAGTDPYIQITSNITSMGGFSIGDSNSTVPVKLISFVGSKDQNNVILNWQTASEINNNHFEIERSIDGKNFNKLNDIKGAGNSNIALDYSYIDKTAKDAFDISNVVYYRLKQVDFDGKYEYSKTISISERLAKEFSILSVQPNPFNEGFELRYTSSNNSQTDIQVTDVFGKTVYTIILSSKVGENKFIMPSNIDLRDGVYFIKLVQNGENRIVKIIKQN
jgi:hypothetical protein